MNGQAWFVGAYAEFQNSSQLITLRARHRDATIHTLLTLAALHQLGITGGEVSITTGLPVKWFHKDKDAVIDWLRGAHHVEINGRPTAYHVTEVNVMPESYGALYRLLVNENGILTDPFDLRTKEIAWFDIGTHTTNFIWTDRTHYIEDKSDSVSVGMADIIEHIIERVLEVHDHELSYRKAEAIERGAAACEIKGRAYDIAPIIAEARAAIAKVIVTEALNLWDDAADAARVIGFGGGMNALRSYIQHAYDHLHILEDPQFANAEGFYRFALLRATS
jgi:plasmid segregation protein ParM